MHKFILPAFAVATVAILAGAAVAEGPGGPAGVPPMHGKVTLQTSRSTLTDQGLRGPVPGGPAAAQASVQTQVFGELASIPVGR